MKALVSTLLLLFGVAVMLLFCADRIMPTDSDGATSIVSNTSDIPKAPEEHAAPKARSSRDEAQAHSQSAIPATMGEPSDEVTARTWSDWLAVAEAARAGDQDAFEELHKAANPCLGLPPPADRHHFEAAVNATGNSPEDKLDTIARFRALSLIHI